MTLAELHDAVMNRLRGGMFAEGIEDFYHADVTAQENAAPPTSGREQMVRNERRFLGKVTAFHGFEERERVIDDHGRGSGIVFYECTMKWDQSDRTGTVIVEQAVVERWQDGKITSIRFYGNYDPGELPPA